MSKSKKVWFRYTVDVYFNGDLMISCNFHRKSDMIAFRDYWSSGCDRLEISYYKKDGSLKKRSNIGCADLPF